MAETGDIYQGIFMFVGLDPEAGKTGRDQFRQTLGQVHERDFLVRRMGSIERFRELCIPLQMLVLGLLVRFRLVKLGCTLRCQRRS